MNESLKHDLRHWLTALLGALSQDDVPLARQAANQMAALLGDVRPAVVSVNDMLRDVGSLLGATRLVWADPDVFVRAAPGALARVLMNLAANAREAMADGGTLTLRAGRDGDHATIAVEDTGPGIPPDMLARMFEAGFTTRRALGGTGLGLAIVREMAEAAGGSVAAESAVGRGTTVTVRWPLSKNPPTMGDRIIAHGPSTDPTPVKSTDRTQLNTSSSDLIRGSPTARIRESMPVGILGSISRMTEKGQQPAICDSPAMGEMARTILLVEDEPIVRRLAERALVRGGWHVVAAESGEAALAAAGVSRPDAVVTDVTLPGMDGRALVDALRGMWPNLPAVLVSGYTDSAARADPMAEKMVFLPKPYTLAALVSALEAIVRD